MKIESTNMFTKTNITTTNWFTWTNRTSTDSFNPMDIFITNGFLPVRTKLALTSLLEGTVLSQMCLPGRTELVLSTLIMIVIVKSIAFKIDFEVQDFSIKFRPFEFKIAKKPMYHYSMCTYYFDL